MLVRDFVHLSTPGCCFTHYYWRIPFTSLCLPAAACWLPNSLQMYRLPPLRLRYDTADNLRLRKILDPSKPQHPAILARVGNAGKRNRHCRTSAIGSKAAPNSVAPKFTPGLCFYLGMGCIRQSTVNAMLSM
jgi:hypothetical protein